ncbi:MAG: nicotinate (nicotinamide) nucleotide adenylyltransferase [Deltaproteobacteria bacterium]|nr:nicotinate (nicotinamide) nucleotide adenylyltransferase [Deltaproteobacteria bacterium]
MLFGGSFDPPQTAHILLGEAARRELQADAVLYMPAARNPLKEVGPHVSDADRIELLRRGLGGHADCFVSDHEISLGGKSYTVDTLRHLRAALDPDAEICMVVGADCLTRLSQWKEIEHILTLARVCVAPRKGFPMPTLADLSKTLGEQAAKQVLSNVLSFDGPEVSSSEVRAALQEGTIPAGSLPEPVAEYIQERKLYARQLEGAAPKISLDALFVVRRLSKLELHQQKLGLAIPELLDRYREQGIDPSPLLACHESLQRSTRLLERLVSPQHFVTRDALETTTFPPNAVILVLGGDDHLKYVAQYAADNLVLAVNPDPWRSDGALTSCMGEELPDVLDSLVSGEYEIEEWTRIEALCDGKIVGTAMSEVRLSEDDVDDMSHHRLCQGGSCAEQKGSGLIVATGAGSGGWYKSAGRYQFPEGNPLGRTEKRARYILREPHEGRLLERKMWHGEISSEQSLLVESLNDGQASISFDAVRRAPFPRGTRVELKISDRPLRIIKPNQ